LLDHPTGLSTTIMSLNNGQEYNFTVAAHNLAGEGAQSGVASATPLAVPYTPTELMAIAGNAQVTLNWTAPFNGGFEIDYYIVYQDGVALLDHPTGLTVIITGLTNGQNYSFTVSAHNLAGEGPQSEAVSAIPYTVPDAPTGLTAIAGNAQVTLNWTAPAYTGPGTLTYHLFRDNVLVWTGSTLSHIETGLINGQEYTYKVSASNYIGWGPNSTAVQTTPVVPVPPGVLSNFHVEAGNANVTLSWDAPTNNGSHPITGIKIYRGVNSSSMTLLTTVTSNTYVDTGLTNGQKYYYQVRAVSNAGDGALSDILDATPSEPGVNGGDNTMLYIGIGVIALLIVIGVAFMVLRKRK
jgi:predicted phage tail protein